jgi:PPM family protein phosphatase
MAERDAASRRYVQGCLREREKRMITSYGVTDVGRRRSLNEDAIFARDGLFIVCDGMGGHKAGEVASQLAIDAIAGFVQRSAEDAEITWPFGIDTGVSFEGNRLRTAIKLANRVVHRKAASSDDYTGMGTTVAALIVSRSRPVMTFANVGDSRIYLIRAGAIQQLSHDDSWANVSWEASDPDDIAIRASMKHVLTKALGAQDDLDFAVVDHEMSGGDVVLLSSDGLSNMLSDQDMLEIVLQHGRDLEAACADLVAAANAQGGRDNISVILAQYAS